MYWWKQKKEFRKKEFRKKAKQNIRKRLSILRRWLLKPCHQNLKESSRKSISLKISVCWDIKKS